MKKCRVVQEKPAENVHLKRDFVGKHGGENSRLFSSHWNLCERRRVDSILVCSILIDVLLFVWRAGAGQERTSAAEWKYYTKSKIPAFQTLVLFILRSFTLISQF